MFKNHYPVDYCFDEALLHWLNWPERFTDKLKQKAGDVQLRVLSQGWKDRTYWDANALQVADTRLFVREIVMCADAVPCWYARTIIPESTFLFDASLFLRLEQESVGDLIFQANSIERVSLNYYAINQSAIEYHWLHKHKHKPSKPQDLPVRFSKLMVSGGFPFYLVEILLPGLQRYY